MSRTMMQPPCEKSRGKDPLNYFKVHFFIGHSKSYMILQAKDDQRASALLKEIYRAQCPNVVPDGVWAERVGGTDWFLRLSWEIDADGYLGLWEPDIKDSELREKMREQWPTRYANLTNAGQSLLR